MYVFKDKKIAELYNKAQMAKIVGIHPNTLRNVLNKGVPCSKLMAYCITKFFDSEAEILDYFNRI